MENDLMTEMNDVRKSKEEFPLVRRLKSMFCLSSRVLFRLPLDEGEARQTFYGLMVAGLFSLPMVLVVYHKFMASEIDFGTKEFFLVFTAVYVLFFVVCSNLAQSISSELRRKLGGKLPRSAIVLAPIAAASNVPEIVSMGQRYWFWQLVGSYLSGMAFSWLGCIFVFLIIFW